MTYTEDLDRAIKRAKEEILDDIETGRVPATVTRFAELHDYVDANEYGGLCEVDLGGEETMSEKLMDFGNALQRPSVGMVARTSTSRTRTARSGRRCRGTSPAATSR
jgi:hypothetical protein